ncbi:MAG: hypothetical protein Terrestrivirus1_299 [Terrestrivirus sp.]|uniref:C2H2-type domain-containing protein n=1 Tax=Terrestrivirus sp. TaxID=2487775 RepID=A0A3G4ZKR1_9VIRU|nr:MAG: hypothetical protein Terrestrivirus1_299 [Terrestrivirus sp.]
MVEYKCDKCTKIFTRKQTYDYHIKRKNACKLTAPDNTKKTPICTDDKKNTENIMCNYCKKTFSRQSSLTRHLNDRCDIKKDDTNKKEEIYQILMKQMEENKKQIQKLEENQKQLMEENKQLKKQIDNKNIINSNNINSNNTNNTINTNNQQNNIKQLNINLVAHGKEDLSFIDEERLKKLFYKGFKSIENLTEIVHFDKNRPENHNIYISNIKDSYVMKYDGDCWKLMNRENCLQDMYEDKSDYLVEKFDELQGKLDEQTIKRFGNFLNRRDEDKIIEQTKREIKLILYNNRKIPEETRRLLRLNDENVIEQLC